MYYLMQWTWLDAMGDLGAVKFAPDETPTMGWVIIEKFKTKADLAWYVRVCFGHRRWPDDLDIVAW